jgi:hypothetical protein
VRFGGIRILRRAIRGGLQRFADEPAADRAIFPIMSE